MGTMAILTLGGWAYYRWAFPNDYSHSCDRILQMALREYAEEHVGFFPSGQATPEASLSLLYPKCANEYVLSGKTVPVERAQKILVQGRLLDPESCGWHYVEGLTLNDDRRLAIFWDKVPGPFGPITLKPDHPTVGYHVDWAGLRGHGP